MIIYIINTIIILMLTSAFMTVWSHNPIYAAFYLCVSFILAAGFLLLFNFEFVALILIIVYVGAIAVLFLFVIYMIDVKLQSLNFSNFFYFYCLFFSLFSFLELFVLLFKHFCTNPYLKEQIYFNAVFYSNWILENDTLFDLNLIGQYLSANLAIHLLLTGLILFLGVLGSISIIFSFNFSKTKQQQIFKQLSKRNNFHFVGAIVQEESFENLFSLIFMTFLEQGLLPEIFIGSSCIIFLIFYLITSINYKTKYPLLSKPLIMLCQLIVFDSLLLIFNDNLIWFYMFHTFNTISSYCFLNTFIKFFVLLLTLFCFFLMERYIIKHQNTHIGEYFILLLFSLLGVLLTITLNDLLSLYLSIEMQSLAFYTLTAFKKKSLYSIENGLKYLILGAVSSSFFLFGACYLYGLTGLFNIFDFNLFWFINQVPNQVSSYFVFWETNNNLTLLILSCLLSSITFLPFLYLCLYSEFYDFLGFGSLDFLSIISDRLSYILSESAYMKKASDDDGLCEFFYDEFYQTYKYYTIQDLMLKPYQKEVLMQSIPINLSPFFTDPSEDVRVSIVNKLTFLKSFYEKKVFPLKTFFDNDDCIKTLFSFIDNVSDLNFFFNNILQKKNDNFNSIYSNAIEVIEDTSRRCFVEDLPDFKRIFLKDRFVLDRSIDLKNYLSLFYPNFISFYETEVKFQTCVNSNIKPKLAPDSNRLYYTEDHLLQNFKDEKKNGSDDAFYKEDRLLQNFHYVFLKYLRATIFSSSYTLTKDAADTFYELFMGLLAKSSRLNDDDKRKKMVLVYQLFQEIYPFTNYRSPQFVYDELFINNYDRLLIDIVQEFIDGNKMFLFFLKNIWEDQLFGESLCLEEISVITNTDLLGFREFDRFQLLNTVTEIFSNRISMLIKRSDHLETVESVIDLLLSKDKSEKISNAILEVGTKNIDLEPIGKRFFLFEFDDYPDSLSFIGKFAINYALGNLFDEIVDCCNSYRKLYEWIEYHTSPGCLEKDPSVEECLQRWKARYNESYSTVTKIYEVPSRRCFALDHPEFCHYILNDSHFFNKFPFILELVKSIYPNFYTFWVYACRYENRLSDPNFNDIISVFSGAASNALFYKGDFLLKDFNTSKSSYIKSIFHESDLSDEEAERLFELSKVYFMYLQNLWDEELFGLGVCYEKKFFLNEPYCATNKDLSFKEFDNFQFFVLESIHKNMLKLIRRMDHLETIEKLVDMILPENRFRAMSKLLLKVIKKNTDLENQGEKLFFDKNSDDLKSVSFITKLFIDHAKEKTYEELLNFFENCQNLFKIIEAFSSDELNYVLKILLKYKNLVYDCDSLKLHLDNRLKFYDLPPLWADSLVNLFIFRTKLEHAELELKKNIRDLEELLFYSYLICPPVIKTEKNYDNINTFLFYDPKEDLFLKEYTDLPEVKSIVSIPIIPIKIKQYCLLKVEELISSIKDDNPSINIQREIRTFLKNQQLSNVGTASYYTNTLFDQRLEFEKIDYALCYCILKREQFTSIVIPSTLFCYINIPILLNVYALEFVENESIKTSVLAQTYNFSTISLIFILISLLFKLASAPFHSWSIDVYETAPTSSTLIFTVIPKLSIIVLTTKFYFFSFYFFFQNNLYQYIILAALLSIFISSIVGVSEKKLKSLFAYSAINNMGYVLISMSTGTSAGLQALYFYLFTYTVSNFVIWSILIALQTKKTWYTYKLNKDFTDLLVIKKINPILVYIFKIVLISIAGIPPLIGFLIKLNIFLSTMEASLYLLSIVIIFFNLISTFYYLRILKILHFEKVFLGKLHENINSKQAYVICFFFFLLLYSYIRPWFIILSTYKIVFY